VPNTGRASKRAGSKRFPLIVQLPCLRSKVKVRPGSYRLARKVGPGAQRSRYHGGVGGGAGDPELHQLSGGSGCREVPQPDVLAGQVGEVDDDVGPLRCAEQDRAALHRSGEQSRLGADLEEWLAGRQRNLVVPDVRGVQHPQAVLRRPDLEVRLRGAVDQDVVAGDPRRVEGVVELVAGAERPVGEHQRDLELPDGGDYRAPDKTTFGAYLTERWLPAQRSQLKASTFHSYRRTIELHVVPSLGNLALARLAPEDLDRLYGRLLASGRRNASGDGPGLSPASVRYVHRIVRKALGDAVRKGTLVRNPASLADQPKRSTSIKREREMHVWTAAQLQKFLASLGGERLSPAFVLAAHTGMRRGEVAGLRWADIDLAAKLIHVRQAATVINYELHIADVKTSNGRRTIDINDDVVRALQTWRRKQAEERLFVGPAYQDGDLVVARPDGRPTHPEILSRTFERLIVRNGLPRIRFHDVRHTHASLLLKAGVPIKVVSERLGHATASFTLDVYGWVMPGMQAEAAAVFSRLVSDAVGDDPEQVRAQERR